MAGKTFSGAYTSTIVLKKPGQTPATLTGSVTVDGVAADSDSGFYSNSYGPWSITNLGSITATGDTSYGILLLTGGIIQNGNANTTGLIQSDETGILLTGAVSTVTNDGAITGTYGRGVFEQDGGTITNGSSTLNHADITGGFEGVAIYNAAGSLTNFGTIVDTGVAGLGVQMYAGMANNEAGGRISGVYGIGFVADYATGTLINAGTIVGTERDGVELSDGGAVTNAGSIGGAIAGILALYGVADVTNSATITGLYAGVDLLAGGTATNQAGAVISGSFGVSMGNGTLATATGMVINNGLITAGTYQGVSLNAGGGVNNSGTIYGAAAGVAAFYGAATVTNTGSIGSAFAGVDLFAGGTLTNAAGATISGGYGVVLANGALSGQAAPPSSLANAGQITGTSRSGVELLTNGSFTNRAGGNIAGGKYGVYIESVTGTIANYGVITGAFGVYGRAVVANGTHYPGQVTVINAGTITGSAGDAVSLFSSNDLLIDRPGAVFNGKVIAGGGRLELAAGGQGTLGTLAASLGGFSTITEDSGASWATGGTVGVGDTLIDFGLLTVASGATLTDKGLITGAPGGSIVLSKAGVLAVIGTVAASATVVFGDATGHLSLTNPATDFAPTVGFAAGDTIYLPDTPLTGLSESYHQGSGQGTLTLVQSGSTIGAITLVGTYSTASFSLKADPDGGSDIVIPCFLAGTRIALADGQARVEQLRPGMHVLTAAGALRPIVWIGHRAVEVARHAEPHRVRPVRIAAHAFGPRRPARALFLSPDHAVFHGGALIPVHLLINGGSVRWAPVERARYYHVELESHDVLLAEGLAVESFRDTGNRAALGLDSGPLAASCAPLALRGGAVARARRHLLVQAGARSRAMKPAAVTLRVGGQMLQPLRRAPERLMFRLPPLAAAATLVPNVPCDLEAAVLDGQALEPLHAWVTDTELRLPRPIGTSRGLELFVATGE